MNDENGQPKKNGLLQLIFGSGDTTVKLVTIALVVISGGGNFLATNNLSNQERDDRDRAVREIHDLHEALDTAFRRQKDIAEELEEINRKLK